eukprot:scaffold55635_cov48-Phaeocystis_antarctica.AAC.1
MNACPHLASALCPLLTWPHEHRAALPPRRLGLAVYRRTAVRRERHQLVASLGRGVPTVELLVEQSAEDRQSHAEQVQRRHWPLCVHKCHGDHGSSLHHIGQCVAERRGHRMQHRQPRVLVGEGSEAIDHQEVTSVPPRLCTHTAEKETARALSLTLALALPGCGCAGSTNTASETLGHGLIASPGQSPGLKEGKQRQQQQQRVLRGYAEELRLGDTPVGQSLLREHRL